MRQAVVLRYGISISKHRERLTCGFRKGETLVSRVDGPHGFAWLRNSKGRQTVEKHKSKGRGDPTNASKHLHRICREQNKL